MKSSYHHAAGLTPVLPCVQQSTALQSKASLFRLAAEGTRSDGTTVLQPTAALSSREEQVYKLLHELSESKMPFRIVVVGDGAILESTNLLGPSMKVSSSRSTGANLITFASNDASFEFHVVIAQVNKVAMVEKESPKTGKVMRIIRFLNGDEPAKSICSFILADDSDDAGKWYHNLHVKYGPELQIG
jgi:hypothetical protein